MKYSRFFVIFITVCILLFGISPVFAATADEINNDLSIRAHVSNEGWHDPVPGGSQIGTVGRALPLEALQIDSNLAQFTIQAHVANLGWQDPVGNGVPSGTVGQALPIEAVKITVDNPEVDVYYRAHSANFGWLGWAKNGEAAGTEQCAFPMECLELVLVPKDSPAPGDTNNAMINRSQFDLKVRTHVSNIGWTDYSTDGVSGTTGQGLPIEAIDISLTDPTGQSGVIGQAYITGIGWQEHAQKNDPIGTTGMGLPIEAFHYQVVGPAAALFSLNYHAHTANIGWLGWTGNDQTAGSANAQLPIEAIEVIRPSKNNVLIENNAYKVVDLVCGIIPPGPTSIVINKSTQMMAYYEGYDVKRVTNVVTGMSWIDDTLAGDFSVLEKLPRYRTKGPGYDAVVDYWLTLYVGNISGFRGEGTIVDRVGIHDADWRSDWSSRAYTYNGSHGCVNTPYPAMKYIFEHVPQGAPVRIR